MDDVDPFLNSDFAVDAIYTDVDGAAHDIRVIFQEPYSQVGFGEGAGYQNTAPTALAAVADVPEAKDNINAETLEVNSVTYHIVEVQIMDTGKWCTLVLSTIPVEAE